jgi:taurine transport system permease protein
VLDWMSDNRAAIAAIVIFALAIMFITSIFIGKKQAKLSAKDAVFGDPERTKGGWYWSVCGISALLLVWFYFSWGVGRAYFPNAANEMCQVAKLEEAISPIKAALPLESRYYKSTTLVARNSDQLMLLQSQVPTAAFSQNEQTELYALISETRHLMANSSNPANLSLDAQDQLQVLAQDLVGLSTRLAAGPQGISPSAEALAQPRWGTTHIEIPMLPITERGVLFDTITLDAQELAARFVKIRNNPSQNDALIVDIKNRIDALKIVTTSGKFEEDVTNARKAYLKAVERIFKRLDDGIIFPAESLEGINTAIATLDSAKNDARGQLGTIEALFFPGDGIVKSRTQCTEQGSGRWLPKPTDVVATFWKLASPNTEADGGFKGIPLFWWKWLPVGNVVAMIMPDWIADILPGEYARHAADGTVTPNFKDKVLALAQGDVNLGAVPMFDGHVWDSMFRVLVALGLGIMFGVPLGIYMGVSKFFKSFFDPLIELYRPVPPLAWAPLILTIFGIQDDGKIFLLFMVAFAIMVISARTGASGTQLSKIRASHSLGATNGQILRNVILPNALPEILTGIRIAIGVCWGTLVAAEMLAGTTGVGFIENVARTVSDYELIWVTILIMGILGLAFDLIMRWVITKTIPWRGKG